MPSWRLPVLSYLCFHYSEISELKDKWRKQPLFLERLAQGWVLLVSSEWARPGHITAGSVLPAQCFVKELQHSCRLVSLRPQGGDDPEGWRPAHLCLSPASFRASRSGLHLFPGVERSGRQPTWRWGLEVVTACRSPPQQARHIQGKFSSGRPDLRVTAGLHFTLRLSRIVF